MEFRKLQLFEAEIIPNAMMSDMTDCRRMYLLFSPFSQPLQDPEPLDRDEVEEGDENEGDTPPSYCGICRVSTHGAE